MIAIKLYGVNSQGIPEEWPKQIIENQDTLPSGYDFLLSKEDFEQYKKDRQSLYNDYLVFEEERKIKEEIIRNDLFEKEKLIKEKLNKQIEEQIQTLTDNGEILANKKGYPIWETFADGYSFPINFILKDFVGLELVVFKSKSAHTKSLSNKPETNTTIWGSITVSDWFHGKSYMNGDEVKRNGKLYVSQIDNNTNDPANSSKDIWLEIKS